MNHSSSQSFAYAGCVSSLRSSMQLLDSSIHILDTGVSDYPRLSKVLQTTRHFELVSEPALQQAQATLLGEIQPEINNLLGRVDVYLDKLARKEQGLIAKCDLQEGRLGRRGSVPQQQQRQSKAGEDKNGDGQEEGEKLTQAEEMRLASLRQKKERLGYAVGRLELQAGQRSRQLRKSMAFQ